MNKAQKTLKRLRGESDRLSTTVYLSQSLLEEFKALCGGVSSSRVLEELIREFIDDLKSSEKTAIIKKASKKN